MTIANGLLYGNQIVQNEFVVLGILKEFCNAKCMKKGNIIVWLKSSQKETFSPIYHKAISYNQFVRELNRRQNLFFAFDAQSYRGDDLFSPVSEYVNGEIVASGKEVVAAVIYNLGSIPRQNFKAQKAHITNTPEFKEFCHSKFAIAEYLSPFSPKTMFIATEGDFWSALKNIETERVVFKPDKGTNGVGVKIFETSKAVVDDDMRAHLEEGAVLQEFIDTRNGIPNICDAYHDLRLVTINDHIVLTHVRIPEEGSLIANYEQGAIIRELSEEMVPEKILKFYRAVHQSVIQRFPKPMYAMDIGVGPSGPQLFELNGHTAFPWPDFACRDFFIQNLIKHLENFLSV